MRLYGFSTSSNDGIIRLWFLDLSPGNREAVSVVTGGEDIRGKAPINFEAPTF
jgi:hypothetical protein